MEITYVHGRQVLDSRGNPTVEVEVGLESGAFGSAAVPSGASTGEHEAVELRDGGDAVGWEGRHARGCARRRRDRGRSRRARRRRPARRSTATLVALDGTPTKARLGANAILGVSLAVAKAAAAVDAGVPLYRWVGGTNAHVLPVPLMNVVNGGAHAQNSLDFQEFMLVPADAGTFAEALRIGAETYHQLKRLLAERGLSTAVGDEGGFAPDLGSAYDACEAILEAAERAGHRDKVALALDPATSELHRDGAYRLERQGGTLDTSGMIDLWADLCDRFPIVSLEDGLGESDWAGWQTLTDRLGGRLQLVGDDLFVTNVDFLRRGIAERVATRSSSRSTRSGRSPRRSTRSSSRTGTATARSSRTARARPRTRRSPTSPSRPTPARSRPAPRPAPTASRSTTSSCGSRRSSATRPSTPVGPHSPGRTPEPRVGCRRDRAHAPHEDRGHHRPGVRKPGDARGADRGRHGRRAPQPLPRDARGPRALGAARPRGGSRGRTADRADRRPPGAEAPRRRPRRRRHARGRRLGRDRRRGRRPARRRAREPCRARLRAPAGKRRARRRRARPAPRREGRAWPRALRGPRRRRDQGPQGRQPARHPAPDPVADAQGPRRSRCRARVRRRLRRALVRPLRVGRPGAAHADRGARLARVGDREDREGGGGCGPRRHPRGGTRRDGGAGRPRRRDRRRRGAAPAEADHHARARAREARDHGDADARVDDLLARADARRGVATSPTRSSTARRRSCSRARRRWAPIRSRQWR